MFLHILVVLRFFVFVAEWYSHHNWGCFQLGALVNEATMNILLETFLWTYALISLENVLIIVGS